MAFGPVVAALLALTILAGCVDSGSAWREVPIHRAAPTSSVWCCEDTDVKVHNVVLRGSTVYGLLHNTASEAREVAEIRVTVRNDQGDVIGQRTVDSVSNRGLDYVSPYLPPGAQSGFEVSVAMKADERQYTSSIAIGLDERSPERFDEHSTVGWGASRSSRSSEEARVELLMANPRHLGVDYYRTVTFYAGGNVYDVGTGWGRLDAGFHDWTLMSYFHSDIPPEGATYSIMIFEQRECWPLC